MQANCLSALAQEMGSTMRRKGSFHSTEPKDIIPSHRWRRNSRQTDSNGGETQRLELSLAITIECQHFPESLRRIKL